MIVVKRLWKYILVILIPILIVVAGFVAYLVWLQPAFYFPKPTCDYAVGVQEFHWIDQQRQELFEHDPQHPNRELMAKIWYPADGKLPDRPTTLWASDLVNHLKKNQKLMWLFFASRPYYCRAQPKAPLVQVSPSFL